MSVYKRVTPIRIPQKHHQVKPSSITPVLKPQNLPDGFSSSLCKPFLKMPSDSSIFTGQKAWWLGGNLVWTAVTGAIVLAVPVRTPVAGKKTELETEPELW